MLGYEKSHGGRDDYFSCKYKKDLVGDCTTRAIALATGEDYMKIMYEQFRIGLELGRLPNDDMVTSIMLIDRRGWRSFSPMTQGNSKFKYLLGQVPVSKNKNYVFRQAGHIVAVVKGVVMDTFDSRSRTAFSYYVEPTKKARHGANK